MFPCSLYFASKLIIIIIELKYAALTLTLMAKGSLVVLCSLAFFAVFSRTAASGSTKVLLQQTRALVSFLHSAPVR